MSDARTTNLGGLSAPEGSRRSRCVSWLSITCPTAFDDTSTDHERFEAEQLAQDRDASRSTADLTDGTARRLVTGLVDDGVATPVAERRVLIHDPNGTAFDSITQLAVFYRGWVTPCDEEA